MSTWWWTISAGSAGSGASRCRGDRLRNRGRRSARRPIQKSDWDFLLQLRRRMVAPCVGGCRPGTAAALRSASARCAVIHSGFRRAARRFSPPIDVEAVKMSNPRAVRYRRLALSEEDKQKADLLYKIADEADRGVLITADWMTPSRYMREPEKRE